MAVIRPWALNARDGEPTYDAQTLRHIFGAFLGAGDSSLRARPGVLDSRGLKVEIFDPDLIVSPGMAVVVSDTGSYVTGIDSEEILTLQARHATYGRVDKLVLEVLDSSTEREGRLRIVAGVPASAPQAPATPSGALLLGQITVPADGGNPASYVNLATYTAARGGTIKVPDIAARNRSYARDGDECFVEADNEYYVRTSGQWQLLWQDTEWVAVPALEGFRSTMQVRRIGRVVYARGGFNASGTGSLGGSYVPMGTLPLGFAPLGASVRMNGGYYSSVAAVIDAFVGSDRVIQMRASAQIPYSPTSNNNFNVAGATWTVD